MRTRKIIIGQLVVVAGIMAAIIIPYEIAMWISLVMVIGGAAYSLWSTR